LEEDGNYGQGNALRLAAAADGAASSSGACQERQRFACSPVWSERSSAKLGELPWLPKGKDLSLCQRVFLLCEREDLSLCAKLIAAIVIIAIVVSTLAHVMESMPAFRFRPSECNELRSLGLPLTVEACEPRPFAWFFYIEAVCVGIFTLDYFARMLTVHSVPSEIEGVFSRTVAYAKKPVNIIDCIAIAPFFADVALSNGSRIIVVRILRLARILRVLKVAKHHPGLGMFAEVIMLSGQPLLILLLFNAVIVILFGTLMYFAEGRQFSVAPEWTEPRMNGTVPALFPTGVFVRTDKMFRGEEVTPFRSMPYAFWWVCTTLTTVGYGDLVPTTPTGKAIGVVCFIAGVLFLALPISVLGANFEDVYQQKVETGVIRVPPTISSYSSRSISALDSRWFPSRKMGLRRGIFSILEDPQSTKLGHMYSLAMTLAILAATAVFIVESMPEFNHTPSTCMLGALTVEDCEPRPDPMFNHVEVALIVFFSVDYVLRIACAHAASPQECGLRGIGHCSPAWQTYLYGRQMLNILDFMAIAPFYLEVGLHGGGHNFAVIRVLRLVRVFRILKMPRLRSCVTMFRDILMESLPALLILLFMMGLTAVFFASLIVFAEGSLYSVEHFPDRFPYGTYVRPTKDGHGIEPTPFRSITYAFWWFFVTATTVGYGDDYPTTTAGRLIGIAAFFCGIVTLALPVTVVSACFRKHYYAWVDAFNIYETEEDVSDEEGSRSKLSLSTVVMEIDRKLGQEDIAPAPSVAWS